MASGSEPLEPNAQRQEPMLSAVVYLFLAHLGTGIALTLLLVSKEAGVKFFRFNAGLAAALVAPPGTPAAQVPRPGGARHVPNRWGQLLPRLMIDRSA